MAKESLSRLAVYLEARSESRSICDQLILPSLAPLYRKKNKVQEREEEACPMSELTVDLNCQTHVLWVYTLPPLNFQNCRVRRNSWFQ